MAIAFFDLDETVIDFNSGGAWLKAELENGNISVKQFLRGAWGLLRYRLGYADLEVLLRDAIGSQAGESEADLAERCHRFYTHRVHGRWRDGALATIARTKAEAHERILLTTASIYLAREVCENLALDGALATRLEVDSEGQFTGRAHGPLCFGPGKVELAKAYAQTRGLSLRECSFFTDSYSDRPMLEAVGTPVVVHPDRRLRHLAGLEGWPIEMW